MIEQERRTKVRQKRLARAKILEIEKEERREMRLSSEIYRPLHREDVEREMQCLDLPFASAMKQKRLRVGQPWDGAEADIRRTKRKR